MTLLGLKWAQDLNNRAAHTHEEFSGVTPWVLLVTCQTT